jgi:cytidylate kinase
MAVITISRELGSGGDIVAQQVAQNLGYHYVDKEFIGKVLSQYGVIEFDNEYDTLPTFWENFSAQKGDRREMMVNMLNRVIRALAHQGEVVILGRSGFAILGGFVDVLNVRIQAPFKLRVRRVMLKNSITAYQAEDIVRQADQVRAAFIKSFYGLHWNQVNTFDLMIDTGKISPALAREWIVTAAQGLQGSEADDQPDVSSIQVDPILANVIADELTVA